MISQNCEYCKTILGINYPQHGYGLTEDQAKRATKTRELAEFIEQAVHEVWRRNGFARNSQ